MTDVSLTPFVGALAAEARDALVTMLGLDAASVTASSLRPRHAPMTGWSAALTARVAGREVTVDVGDNAGAREAWFRTAHLAWAYRSTDGDPFAAPETSAWLRALKDRATRADASPIATGAARAFLDAVGRALPFAPVTDESYRLLMQGPQGPTAILWLGFRCDHDCVMCWQGRSWPEPPAEFFHRWLDEMLAAGARAVSFSGGEPTLHPELPALVRRAKSAGAHVIVETNAAGLGGDALRRSLIDAGVDEVFASLHAADPSTSDALTRAPGAHARTLAGVAACLDDGVPVGLHCVVERANAGELAAHARLVVERFVRPYANTARAGLLRRVSYSMPTRYADEDRYRRGIAPVDLARPGLSAAVKTLRDAGVEARVTGMGGFPLCAVDDPRSVAPATAVTEGERQGRVHPPACGACALRDRCGGVSTLYLEACGPSGLRPATPR